MTYYLDQKLNKTPIFYRELFLLIKILVTKHIQRFMEDVI